MFTNSPLSRTRFSLHEIYELLHWFELDLTDHKIANRLSVDYHKVHRFFMTVRDALAKFQELTITVLDQEVEVDETYFGPDFRNRRKYNREKLKKEGKVKRGRGANEIKQAVFGIFERKDGLVFIKPVTDVQKDTLQDIIKNRVSLETTIYSDTYRSYNGLDEEFEDHKTVRHKEEEYVRGSAGINGIEGFWGYAKERLVKYHGMSASNFLSYLKEIEFRFNHRDMDSERFIDYLLEVLIGRNSILNSAE